MWLCRHAILQSEGTTGSPRHAGLLEDFRAATQDVLAGRVPISAWKLQELLRRMPRGHGIAVLDQAAAKASTERAGEGHTTSEDTSKAEDQVDRIPGRHVIFSLDYGHCPKWASVLMWSTTGAVHPMYDMHQLLVVC